MAGFLQGVGLLVMGGVIGDGVSRLTVSGALLLALIGVGGLLIFLAGCWLARRRTRAQRDETATKVHGLGHAIVHGLGVLDDAAAWSREHPYTGPSTLNDDAATLGAISVEKDALLRKMLDWGEEAGRFVQHEFGLEVIAFRDAAPRLPSVYIHDHLQAAWAETRGRVAWLTDRIGRSMSG